MTCTRNKSFLLLLAAVLSAAAAAQTQELNPKVKLFIPYKEYSQEENQKILQLFDGLRVADISDGMDGVGLADVGLMGPSSGRESPGPRAGRALPAIHRRP